MTLPPKLHEALEAAADYYTDDKLCGQSINEEHVHTAFTAGAEWLYSELMKAAPEWDEQAARAAWQKIFSDEVKPSALSLARWQFDQCKAEIAALRSKRKSPSKG